MFDLPNRKDFSKSLQPFYFQIDMPLESTIREKIVSVANNIFRKYGYKKATIEEIATAARKGKSTVYHYFKNKEEIFTAVLEKEIVALKYKLVEILSEDSSSQAKLRNYIVARMKLVRQLSSLYYAVRLDYLRHLPFIEKLRQRYDQEEIMMIKMALDEGVEKNEFEIDDTEMAAETISITLKGLEQPMFYSQEPPEKIETHLHKMLDMLFYGILKKTE